MRRKRVSPVKGPTADGKKWDWYVKRFNRSDMKPGDEWGTAESWHRREMQLLTFDEPVHRVVEIGQGSGKYTERILRKYPECQVLCVDVSQAFLDEARHHLHEKFGDRLSYHCLGEGRDNMLNAIREWAGTEEVDLLFSIDAMVHVDQPMLVNYFSTAHSVLRKGGYLSMTVACLENPRSGVTKLVDEEVDLYYRDPSRAGRMYYWSMSGLTNVLGHIGFEISHSIHPARDIEFTALKI